MQCVHASVAPPHYLTWRCDGNLPTPLLRNLITSLAGTAPKPDARQDDAYLFDITDPRRPVKTKSAQLVATAVTDHVFGLANGNFLVTQVRGREGSRECVPSAGARGG